MNIKRIMEIAGIDTNKLNESYFSPNDRIINTKNSDINMMNIVDQKSGMKPYGLWYAFGDSWIEWIKTEMPDRLKEYYYKLEVDTSKILQISSPNELLDFTEEFKDAKKYDSFYIDWKKVAEKYSGIEINPYIWEMRMSDYTSWYYGWDVASGCVWDRKAVKKIEKIQSPKS